MALLRLARHAMATRFELVLCGSDPVRLRAAGEEALNEIERLENQLSLFRPTSEIARLNARAAFEPVRVSPAVFGLLEHAGRLSRETEGAFDITIAPLMRCWGFQGGTGQVPRAEALTSAREAVGMHLVHLNPHELSVRFERKGVMLDLGAIGKGFAIERAIELVREAGVTSALLHGGTSTVYGLGCPPDAGSWKVEIPDPRRANAFQPLAAPAAETGDRGSGSPPGTDAQAPFATVLLRDTALSVSAVWGKAFQSDGCTFGHILDPRTGEPARRAVLSAVVMDSATESDALSTALLTLGPAGHDRIAQLRPGMGTLVVGDTGSGLEVRARGIAPDRPL